MTALGVGSGGPGSAGRQAIVLLDNRLDVGRSFPLHYWNGDTALGTLEIPGITSTFHFEPFLLPNCGENGLVFTDL